MPFRSHGNLLFKSSGIIATGLCLYSHQNQVHADNLTYHPIPSDKYELTHVAGIFRHGARLPNTRVPRYNELYPNVRYSCHPESTLIESELGGNFVLFQRRFLKNPKDQVYGRCQKGQLTRRGGLQHEELGLVFRGRYAETLGLEEYDPKKMFAMSSNVLTKRTQESGQHFMVGFFHNSSPQGQESEEPGVGIDVDTKRHKELPKKSRQSLLGRAPRPRHTDSWHPTKPQSQYAPSGSDGQTPQDHTESLGQSAYQEHNASMQHGKGAHTEKSNSSSRLGSNNTLSHNARPHIPFVIYERPQPHEILFPTLHSCPRLSKAWREWKQSKMVQEHYRDHARPLRKAIQLAFGLPSEEDVHSLRGLHNSLACVIFEGLPLPDVITKDVLEGIEQHRLFYNVNRFKGGNNVMAKMAIGRTVNLLYDFLVDPGNYKMHLLFAHDSSLVPLLVLLGQNMKQWPPFASHVVFESYERVSDGEQFVRILYDQDEGEAMVIDGMDRGEYGLYKKEDLLHFFEENCLVDYKTECRLRPGERFWELEKDPEKKYYFS